MRGFRWTGVPLFVVVALMAVGNGYLFAITRNSINLIAAALNVACALSIAWTCVSAMREGFF